MIAAVSVLRQGLAVAAMICLAGGCTRPAETHASAVDRAACRHRADQVYALQNREDVFRNDTYVTSTRDTPFAAQGLSSVVTRGLSGQFVRDQMIEDCLDGAAGNVGTTPAAPDPNAARE